MTDNDFLSDFWRKRHEALWSAQLWAKARQDNVVLPLFRQLEMPSNPFYVPAEGVDPKVVYVPETRHESQLALNAASPAIPSDKIGTAKVELTAQKLALRVGFSAELVEDAVLPVLGIYREQVVRAILDSIDNVLLNGDTTTGGGNLNDSDGTLGEVDTVLTAWAEARDMLPKQPEPHNEYCIRCGGPVYDGRDMCLDCRREEEER